MAVTVQKLHAAAALLFLAVGPALADDAPDCTSPQTQTDMTECAGEDYEKADRQLNAEYQKVRKQLAERDRSAEESDKGATDALITAQRAWVAFRDANCDAFGFQARGGTMEPMLVSACLADMSSKRADELRQFSEGF
ncbi:lysozyme inhibitor LprI family protein [Rhizobium nepotum]|uniref:lysozyme inhibitor LprI family protein n=1 Tax=Rhizobium nepotum TaxID=1035271 RepID=UPI0005D37800|nr:lysozyme inhibitor LprI family protein [Rhizobium nepotum]